MSKGNKVSVVITTYQHVNYIATCLDSILAQQTTFPYEILIGEDASKDGTREICQQYAEKHPDKIKLFLRKREDVFYLFGKPVGQNNFQKTLLAATGKYIAICEGDDYWTAPNKLQKQVDFLEANPDYAGCFHDAILVDQHGQLLEKKAYDTYIKASKAKKDRYNQRQCLQDLKSHYPTCSLLFRSSVFQNGLPDWLQKRSADEMLDIAITQHGDLAYMKDNMAAYRKHTGGVWQGGNTAFHNQDLLYRAQLLYNTPEMRQKYAPILRRRIQRYVSILAEKGSFSNRLYYTWQCFLYADKLSLRHWKILLVLLARLVAQPILPKRFQATQS